MTEFEGDQQFQRLLAGRGDVDLVQLMLELAADAYPDLDRYGCLLEIDRFGVACSDHPLCRRGCDARKRLMAISQQLYEVEGFHGDHHGYYQPQNSYLNEVLARRCGIPISLGILYMAVATRTGLKMFGCNTPGHFVVGCCCGGGDVLFVDPFSNGDVLDREACKSRIVSTAGPDIQVCNEHFRAAAPLDIVARVLRNLKTAHAMQEHWSAVLSVQQRLAALLPQIPQERRDLGLIYLRLGQPGRALPVLEHYVKTCGSDQAAALQPSIQAARRMIAECN